MTIIQQCSQKVINPLLAQLKNFYSSSPQVIRNLSQKANAYLSRNMSKILLVGSGLLAFIAINGSLISEDKTGKVRNIWGKAFALFGSAKED